jgi:two-component system sensor histidine kinase YesM
MSKERLEEVRLSLEGKGTAQQPLGLGVRSTHERLRLHYGKKAGLKIESQHNLGTCVKVMIPI